MKKIVLLALAAVLLSTACKSKKESPEEKSAQDRVKEDKRKSDSVFEYHKRKADSAPDSI